MRQFNPATNLVLAVLAGVGLLASLSLSWFAAPSTDPTGTDGPVERGAYQVSQFFATHARGQVSGHDALGGGRMAIYVLVVAVAAVALMVTVSALRSQAETLLQLLAYAAPLVVIVAAVAHTGTATPVRVHYGFLASLAICGLMSSAAYWGATLRLRRRTTGRVRISQS